MTAIEHAILATSILAAFFYYGKYLGKKQVVDEIIEHTLATLEKGNYIKVKYHGDSKEKELIPLDTES